MPTSERTAPPFPSLTWEQNRLLQHAFLRSGLPVFDAPDIADAKPSGRWSWLGDIEPPYRQRAKYFNQFGVAYAQLGALTNELRLSVEPLHPLPDAEAKQWVQSTLKDWRIASPDASYGLSVLSRAQFTAYNPAADLFGLAKAPAAHPDLFLFDPLVGFVQWLDGDRVRNFWLGNQRDILEMEQADPGLRALLVPTNADHFTLGKSMLLRVVGPLMRKRWPLTFDDADIPTVTVESQRELEALVDDIRNACAAAPAKITPVFRGQTSEHFLPDRSALVKRLVCPYSDVRDHSVVPSLYRHSDAFLNDPAHFRAFVTHLLDWGLYSDLVFGEPATYLTPDGRPHVPKDVPPTANAVMTMHMSGSSRGSRALEDMGPYTAWRVTDDAGNVLDEYVKLHRPGHDGVRRNLILQHYGAPTPFIDVTHDIRVAEWFAFNTMRVGEDGLSTSGMVASPYGDSSIFVFLALDGLTPIVDTEQLTTPSEALRPHRQACAVLGGAGNLYRNAASRFIGLKIKFADGFRPSGLPTARHLFPGPDEDPMLAALLARYDAPVDLPRKFPVYWFPDGAPDGDRTLVQSANVNDAEAQPEQDDKLAPPRGEFGSARFEELFPRERSLRVFAELGVWTSVDDCLAASRFLEKRPLSTDTPSRKLILPYPDDDDFERVFVQGIDWLIHSFAVPPAKCHAAKSIDPAIREETIAALLDTKFRANIDKGEAGTIDRHFPALRAHRDERFFVVSDDPRVIELVQNPLRCLKEITTRAWSTARRFAELRDSALRTGNAPRIFHQPYTDGPLFALVEALAFFAYGLDIGPNAMPTEGINRGYRSVEVVGRPPIDLRLFEVAHAGAVAMFKSLE